MDRTFISECCNELLKLAVIRKCQCAALDTAECMESDPNMKQSFCNRMTYQRILKKHKHICNLLLPDSRHSHHFIIELRCVIEIVVFWMALIGFNLSPFNLHILQRFTNWSYNFETQSSFVVWQKTIIKAVDYSAVYETADISIYLLLAKLIQHDRAVIGSRSKPTTVGREYY
jgi:hypothetical protein